MKANDTRYHKHVPKHSTLNDLGKVILVVQKIGFPLSEDFQKVFYGIKNLIKNHLEIVDPNLKFSIKILNPKINWKKNK
jgi:hypothetical protein